MKQFLILLFGLLTFLLGAPKTVAAEDVSLQFAPPETPSVPMPLNDGVYYSSILPEAPSNASSSTLPEAPSGIASSSILSEIPSVAASSSALPEAPSGETRSSRLPVSPVLAPSATVAHISAAPQHLFTGGSDSLVARAVGTAEGTRTPEGRKTTAYYGHVDPGNQRWNLGSFSYQHGARSPEQADAAQLQRLQTQFAVIEAKADSQGLRLSLSEQLNAIDLANQAPLAALAHEGYVDQLRRAKDQGLQGDEAVLQARTEAFWDPDRQQWDAPGLGNQADKIRQDQARRLEAIARTLRVDAIYLPTSPRVVASQTIDPATRSAEANSAVRDVSGQISEQWPLPVAVDGSLTFARQEPIGPQSATPPLTQRSVVWDDTVPELPNS